MLGWNETHRSVTSLAVIAVATSIVGCGDDLYEPRLVNSLSEAVSFHVSDDAVIPYGFIKDKMKPNFQLKYSAANAAGKVIEMSPGDGALARVLPTTGYYEQQVIQALSAALAIHLPTTTTSNQTTSESKEGKTNVVVNNSTTYASGAVPTIDDLKKVQPGASDRAMTKIEALKTDDKNRPLDQADPLLKYNLAAALVQEVAMLNDAIDHIESAGTGYETYILRLRVAMQPLAPNQPYNAQVALGFFCIPSSLTDKSSLDYEAPPQRGQDFVKVHPLLVTDDLEATSTARTAQLITQLSAAVTGMIGPTGIGGLFNSERNRIRTLLGKDLNSTFSISRTADNAVSVRLGAPRQPTAGYAMINRNHAVSLVLQAPKGCSTINITFAGSLRNANTGELVPDPAQPIIDASRAALHRLLESYAVTDKSKLDRAIKALDPATMKGLTDSIQQSDYAGFYEKLARILEDRAMRQAIPQSRTTDVLKSWRSLWGKLAEIRSLSPYQNVSVRLPVKGAGPGRGGPTPSYTTPRDPGGPASGSPGPKGPASGSLGTMGVPFERKE